MRTSLFCLLLLTAVSSSLAAQALDTRSYEPAVRPVQVSIHFAKELIPQDQIPLFRQLETATNLPLIDQYYPLAQGSGFFVSDRGHLITNYHVVDMNAVGITLSRSMNSFLRSVNQEHGSRFTKRQLSDFADTVLKFFLEGEIKRFVLLPDGEKSELELIASDPERDLAILQLTTPRKTQAVQFIRAKDLRDVREVYSIGYPLPDTMRKYFEGTPPTVSSGIISAMRERLLESVSPRRIRTFQHTASINPGNSGGPLVTGTGLVVGVNSSLLTDARNIYFAISVEEIEPWLAEHELSRLLQFRSYVPVAAVRTVGRFEVGFTSSPSEAQVYVDDDLVGVTPITTKLLGPREYDVTVKKAGYIDLTDTILVLEEHDRSFEFSLTAGAKVDFDGPLPSTIRVLARKGEQTRTFEYDEPVALTDGLWAVRFAGPISSDFTAEVTIEGQPVRLSPGAFLSPMKLAFPNLLPESEILLRPSSEALSPAAGVIELPYGGTELLVRTPFYRDNILEILPDYASASFEVTVDYERSNAYLYRRNLTGGLSFLIGGLVVAGASAILNLDTVAAGISNTYQTYAVLKYLTFGTLVAGSASSVIGVVGTTKAARLRKRPDEPVVTQYDFTIDKAGK